MKLFKECDAVKFPEEDLIFITMRGYLYYIYDPKSKIWRKYRNAGNDRITIKNYPDVGKTELMEAMDGNFPSKETDFMRLCTPAQLCVRDMMTLLQEDFPRYMSNYEIYRTAQVFLSESDSCRHKSYEKVRDLFNRTITVPRSPSQIVAEIKKLSFTVIGRDIFKKEIGIVDGANSSSYFLILPVRFVDSDDPNDWEAVAGIDRIKISIEEQDVAQYLAPFLFKYFDENLYANKKRIEEKWTDCDGVEHISCAEGFEWHLTDNFYTFDSVSKIMTDIKNTIDTQSQKRIRSNNCKLKIKGAAADDKLRYTKNLTDDQVETYNEVEAEENHTKIDLVIDFYQRFLYRMEYMMKIGKEKGCNLITFVGP